MVIKANIYILRASVLVFSWSQEECQIPDSEWLPGAQHSGIITIIWGIQIDCEEFHVEKIILKKILKWNVIFDSWSRLSTLEGSLQGQSGSKWISLYCSSMHTSRGSKVVLPLYKLNFGFFAEIISKGTNLEDFLSYANCSATPPFEQAQQQSESGFYLTVNK